jgi:uncharacterized membrane protein
VKNRLRDLLVDGLLFALPLGAAAYLLHSAIGLLSKLLVPAQRLLPEGRWFGIAAVELAAFVVLLLILLLLGAFARSAPGRRVAGAIESVVLSKVPFYQILKNIAADLSGAEVDSSRRPALVAFDDNTVLGFIVEESADAATLTVFVPGAPGAASGSVVLVPRTRVHVLDAPTSRAMRAMKQRGLGLQGLTHAPPPGGAPDGPASGVR